MLALGACLHPGTTATNRDSGAPQSGRALRLIALGALLFVALEQPARAYTDPGTGALVWQALLAGLTGLVFYSRRIIRWVKSTMPNKGTKQKLRRNEAPK